MKYVKQKWIELIIVLPDFHNLLIYSFLNICVEFLSAKGLGNEHFWVSGTDLADEGNFFWMANGRPITFTNWNAGEPNNFRYENGEEENCMELWNRDGKGLKWNDSPCSFETFFVCEI